MNTFKKKMIDGLTLLADDQYLIYLINALCFVENQQQSNVNAHTH